MGESVRQEAVVAMNAEWDQGAELFDEPDAHREALVSLTDDGWVWRISRTPLSFDECEQLGVDGTLRDT